MLAVAGWLRFLRGYDYAGEDLPVEGPRMHLVGIARRAMEDPRPLLAEQDVFDHLGADPAFVAAVERALQALEQQGPREVIERYLDAEPAGDRAMIERFGELDASLATTLLCDADGTLFPSEEPAYAASAAVVNRFLAELGAERAYGATELQAMTNGKNFRGRPAAGRVLRSRARRQRALAMVAEEKDVVTAHLRTVLHPNPDPDVREALSHLRERYVVAAVTSSAASRLDACLEITELAPLFAPERRFSAEDSLPQPTSKPDPAIYTFAARRLGITPDQGIAIEDSINGALSAVAAGFPTIGIVVFVPPAEREGRSDALPEAGVAAVVSSWPELLEVLSPERGAPATPRGVPLPGRQDA